MRTTLTLDEDVAARLQHLTRERGISFKVAVNETLRAGLGSDVQAREYRLPTYSMGVRSGIDLDRALQLDAALEDEEIPPQAVVAEVILPDVNILLYAIDETSPHHAPAKAWLEKCLSGTETFALTWSVLGAFLRLTTRAAVFARPLELAQAFDLVDSWLAQPSVAVVHPTPRHHIVLRRLLEPLGTAGNLVPDAHLAALALEHGATVASCDRDFGRFVGVAWSDPMSG